MPHAYYDLISEETRHLDAISKLSRQELGRRKRAVLSKYLRNEVMVDAIVSHDLFLSEYAFLERVQNEAWLRSSLEELLAIFWRANEKNKAEFVSLLIAYKREVARAADNCAQIEMVTPLEVPAILKGVVKLTFRDIGDFLEGSYQVFTKFVLSCLYLVAGKDFAKVNELTFGKCVSEILDAGHLQLLYKPEPWNVPLSQWRNISNHNSYSLDRAEQTITCEYGAREKTRIQVTPDELFTLKFNLGRGYTAHKVAHALLFIENGSEVAAQSPEADISIETIGHQIKEFTLGYGFAPMQTRAESPLTELRMEPGEAGGLRYYVVNRGDMVDIVERGELLAGTIARFIRILPFSLEICDERSEKLSTCVVRASAA